MKLKYFLELTLLASIWGSSFIFTRLSVHEFGPVPLTALRSGVAAVVLLIVLGVSGQLSALKTHWLHLLVIGLTSTALPFVFLSMTTQFSTAGFASILNASMPIFSALIACLWLKEYLSVPAVIGIALGFIGVIVMVVDKESITSDLIYLPILTGATAAFLYGFTGNYSRKFMQGVSPLVIAAGSQLFATLCIAPFAVVLWPEAPISSSSLISVGLLGVLCTGVAYILYFRLLENVGVANTALVTYLVPVFAILWGSLFLSETISWPMVMGAGFILTGITLTTGLYKQLKKPKINMQAGIND